MLLVQTAPRMVRAQEIAPAPPQSAPAPEGQQKQRSADETAKLLKQLACGPSHVRLLHHTYKGPQVLSQPAPDKGLIYVIRTKNIVGAAGQTKLAMDGKWVGVNRIGNYFYIETDPGPHYFCSAVGPNRGLLSLMIEKGKTYYLRETVTMGGVDLDLLDENDGKEHVSHYHRSFFEEKPKK